MDFATMLARPVQPLENRMPEKAIKPDTISRSMTHAHIARHNKSFARYKAVMGAEWVPTATIESRLGTGRGCVLPTLADWEKMGCAVRRKKGDPKSWNRNVGFEWKLIP